MTTPTVQRLQAYRDSPAISQSELKSLLSGKQFSRKPSLTMLLGSYLDCLLLTPEIKDELYYICDIDRPTQTIVDLCNSLFSWVGTGFVYDEEIPVETDLTKYSLQIEQWIETEDYYSNRPNTRVDKFIKEAKDWWKVVVQKGEREIITTMEQVETELMVMTLLNDCELNWLWKGEFQKDFYWTEKGIDCKGLGDICLPGAYVDLKYTTCPNLESWIKVCANLNYPFQMAFYKSGLNVDKCYWLVVSKDWRALVEVNELMLQIGKWGYSKWENIRIGKVETEIEKHYPGYIDGLDLIKGKTKDINELYTECILGQ